jgi:methionyl-tRNA formyltransferase
MNKIGFYLMGQKGFSVLQNHLNKFGKTTVAFVVSSHDNHIQKDFYTEIESLCKKNNLEFYNRNTKKKLKAYYSFAISWRWMIDMKNLIVFHDSLLPKYRGFSPLVNMLINGETRIGVTALFAGKEYDSGSIISQKAIDIKYPIKIQHAIELICPLYCDLAEKIAEVILSGKKPKSKKQNDRKASYSLWRDENDYRIDWNKSSDEIKRFIDAVGSPFKGAITYSDGKIYRINDAEIVNDVEIENRDVGKVIFFQDDKPIVVCGNGLLKITSMTSEEGKNALPLKKFRTRFE